MTHNSNHLQHSYQKNTYDMDNLPFVYYDKVLKLNENEDINIKADEYYKEVTVYFFRGDGCPHCEEFESWLQEIEPEYGNLFKIIRY